MFVSPSVVPTWALRLLGACIVSLPATIITTSNLAGYAFVPDTVTVTLYRPAFSVFFVVIYRGTPDNVPVYFVIDDAKVLTPITSLLPL